MNNAETHSILYVDKRQNNLHFFEDIFKDDYNVLTSDTLENALDILQNEDIHLVITEEKTEGMSGFEFLEKTLDKYPDLIRIALTQDYDPEILKVAINRGQTHYYMKQNWNENEFRFIVNRALETYDLNKYNQALLLKMKNQQFAMEKVVEEKTNELKEKSKQLRNLNTMLTEMNKNLFEANQKKNDLLEMVAHNIRNPLQTILGYTELLKYDMDRNEKPQRDHRKDLDIVQTSANRISKMAKDLLDIASIEAGNFSINPVPVDLKILTLSICQAQEGNARAKNINLNINSISNLPKVEVDRDKAKEILENLLSNAIKFTHPDGRINVSFEAVNGSVITHVADTGQGLSSEDQKHLFKSHKKLSATPTGGESSNGLGLYIVKKILEIFGGKIWVDSQKNVGSTFSFSLPIVKN